MASKVLTKKEPEKPSVDEKTLLFQRRKPLILLAMSIVNSLILIAAIATLWKGHKIKRARPTLQSIVDEKLVEASLFAGKGQSDGENYVGKLIPLDTLVVNLVGENGMHKMAKINMDVEPEGTKEDAARVEEELLKRRAFVRDVTIIEMTGKTYEQVSTKEAKDVLRSQIRDALNRGLLRGQIKNVYFADFVIN